MLHKLFDLIKQNILLSIILCIIIYFIVGNIYFINKQDYEILYKDLSLEDASRITQQLDENNIEWKYDKVKKSIMVPSDIIDEIKKLK
ncbi:hypothetical protein [Wukongibacter sp. M2B1]|uniref:hypothetical protein n=1 Tax=Wukongibacter sp. M2B1 TaxID=3088895 RepID=UPI003D7BBA91